MSAMPASVQLGSPILMTGNVSSTQSMSALSMSYTWGDGQSNTDPYTYTPSLMMTPVANQHYYSATGGYTIVVTANATYSNGSTDTATVSYPVTILPPASPPPPPPPPPLMLADVRVESIRGTSENALEPTGQFNLIRLGGDLAQPLTVSYSVAGTATSVVDYNPLLGSITFAAYATTATISVTTIDDFILENEETVVVTLLPQPHYHVLTPAGMDTLVIADDEQIPTALGSGQGLYGKYFNSQDFTDLKTSRIDPTVKFDWTTVIPPGIGLPSADQFSVRWTGKVEPRLTGEYTFYITGDDGAKLWVNGVLLFDKWTELPGTWAGKITLQAGQKYDIKIEYHEIEGSAAVNLEWSHEQLPREIVPQSQLYPEVQGEGTGLLGTYFDTPYLTSQLHQPPSRVDSTVNFNWGTDPVGIIASSDKFSVRWGGKIQPLVTGSHLFYLNADDGVRLWVNGQHLINDWNTTTGLRSSPPIELVAGSLYDIQIEYYEWTVAAEIHLSWSYLGQSKTIVPQSQLYPTSAPPVFYATGNGLTGTYSWSSGQNASSRTRIDSQGVNFDWGEASPSDANNTIPADNFNVRWTGYIQPLYTERYSFYAYTDDGVVVWVNGIRVVNDFTPHSARESGPHEEINLVAGSRYSITVQYLERTVSAVAKLLWSSASQAKEVVPGNRLYPDLPSVRALQGPAGEVAELPTGSQELRWLVSPNAKATILAGVPFWRESGGEVLAKPADVAPYQLGGNRYWKGVIPFGAFIGPSGCGPCVGVALVPSDPSQPTYVYHFKETSVVVQSFLDSGFAFGDEVRPGYRAVLCGALKPPGNSADPQWQTVNSLRLYTLEDVVEFLRDRQVPITAYLPTSGFAVDSNGWVYWTESPSSPDEALRYES